jgi:hypothetical protein
MPRDDLGDFAWTDYAPAHRLTILLAFRKARTLHHCLICKRPAIDKRALIHLRLKQLDAEALDPRNFVKPLALCKQHMTMTNDDLADVVWPGWREAYGAGPAMTR